MRRSNMHHIKFPGVNEENRGQERFEEMMKKFLGTDEKCESTNTKNTMYSNRIKRNVHLESCNAFAKKLLTCR